MSPESTRVRTERDTGEAAIWFIGTKISCKVADVLNEMTSSHLGDQKLLEFARATKLHSMKRSQKYLSQFLNGKGETQTFPLTELLKDPGVSRIVCRHFRAPLSHSQNVITIGQRAYTDQDWRNSLGTYFIYYVDVGSRKNFLGKETRYVLAWGEDTYQWAPDDAKRFTQCIHQAASRLQNIKEGQIPKAATFKMLASETVIDTTTGLPAANFLGSSGASMQKVHLIRQKSQPMCRGQ
jgi:hypothetical protein